MEPTQLLSHLALLSAATIVALKGERPEKLGLLIIVGGWLLTPVAESRASWVNAQFGMFAVDLVALLALVTLGHLTRTLWPLCAGALQFVSTCLFIPFWIWPHELYRAFYYGNFTIGYLILGSLVGGALVEVRQRRMTPLPGMA